MGRVLAAIVLSAVLAGCAARPACNEAVSDLLYFGTETPGGAVGAEDWSSFLRDVVTPRFPEGFTTWPARGQWKSSSGTIQKEASYIVNIVHPEAETSEAAIRAIIDTYKSRFRQESVLRVSSRSCISF